MKKYLVTSHETMEYSKVVDAKNETDAHKKAYSYTPNNEWEANYKNCEVVDWEVEEYHGE